MRVKLLLITNVFLLSSALGQSTPNFRQVPVEMLRNGKYIEALEYLNVEIRKEPGVPELYFLRGYAKYGLDDLMGAEQDYTTSIGLSPYLSDVFVHRGIVRTQLQNYQGAMEDFDHAQELEPSDGEIFFHRARANLLLKKYYSCIVDCNKAIRMKFRDEGVFVLRASAEQEIKRYDEAIADLDTAARINPKSPNVRSQRGLVWNELEKPDSALADFNRAIVLDSTNTYALFNRALTYVKIKGQAAALDDLNEVIRLSPYNSYAYYNRAIVLIGLDRKREAIRDFDIVSRLDPKNIISCYYRSRLKSDLGDYRGALEDLDKTIALLPDYTDAWYDRYEVKLRMGDTRGAQADYRRALELTKTNRLNPDSLKSDKKDYLKSLVRLSGDFEEMNTMSGKVQNQSVDIQLRPMFAILLWKADFGKIRAYDVYGKEHYFTSILTLTNETGLPGDSVPRAEAARMTRLIDSAGPSAHALFRRGVCWFRLRDYARAVADLDAALALDSCDIASLFTRAGARYELIQEIRSQEDLQQAVILSMGSPKPQLPDTTTTLVHTYDAVLRDLDRVLALDTLFPFAWYNRGFVNSRMGNYGEAIRDFTNAIALRADLPEAFYDRGLISILLGENRSGCLDLSRAGEQGIADAYRVMKRYCYK